MSDHREVPRDDGLVAVLVLTIADHEPATFLIDPESIAGEG